MNYVDSSFNSEPILYYFAHTNVALEGISEVRPFDIIVMKFRDEAIIMGLGLIIEGDIFIIYYLLNRLDFKV